MTRVCIIGAGCSGITTAKRLQDHGIDYDQFELSDDVGGNWYFRNPNGRSAVYESLHIDTSKTRLQFEDFPVPQEWPDFPSHRLMHDYFRAYVDHFGLRDGHHVRRRRRVGRTPRRGLGGDAVDRRDPGVHRPGRRQRPPLEAVAAGLGRGPVRRRA